MGSIHNTLAWSLVTVNKKGENLLSIYCNVCASTIGPFVEERLSASVTSHSSLIRCHPCMSKYYGASLEKKTRTKREFAYNFSECSNCKALFYSKLEGIPFAQSQFEVNNCPQCGNPFPPIDEASIQKDANRELDVLRFVWEEERSLVNIKVLYNKVVSAVLQHPNLVNIICEIRLVKSKSNSKLHEYDIWIVNIASIRGRETISFILQKAMEKKFLVTHSQLLKFAKKERGIKVIESIKVEKSS